MNLLSVCQAGVESTGTMIAVAGNILWLACQLGKWMQLFFVFALARDKRLFCFLRCFLSLLTLPLSCWVWELASKCLCIPPSQAGGYLCVCVEWSRFSVWDITSCSLNCFAADAVLEGKWHKEDETAFLFERNKTQKCAVYLSSCCQACEISLGLYSSPTAREENKKKAFQFRLKD